MMKTRTVITRKPPLFICFFEGRGAASDCLLYVPVILIFHVRPI